VHIAQPCLQPRDGLAIAGEAEVAGLDDARMHGATRDLVQACAVHGQELIALFGSQGPGGPDAVIEPAACIGQAQRIDVVEVAHRAFEPHGRHMMGAYRGVHAVARFDRNDGPLAVSASGLPQGHVHIAAVEPKSAQIVPALGAAFRQAGPKRVAGVDAEEAVRRHGLLVCRGFYCGG
jgi:hypothetical protein